MNEIWMTIQEIYRALHNGGLPDMGIWSYVVLGGLVATEGPLSTLLGAAAAAAGLAELRWILMATILGNVIGDCIWYSVGYLGKAETLRRAGRYVGVKTCHVDRLEGGMQAHAVKLILLSKVAYGLIVPTLVAAGMARVPVRKWFPIVFIMETIWSLILVYVGYHATWLLVDFQAGLRTVGIAALLVVIGAGVGLMFYRRRRQRHVRALISTGAAPMQPTVAQGAEAAVDTATQNAVARASQVDSELKHTVKPATISVWRNVPAERNRARNRVRVMSMQDAGRITELMGHSMMTHSFMIHSFIVNAPIVNAPAPLARHNDPIAVRFGERVQVFDPVSGVSGSGAGRWSAEPVEGRG